ncbi:hypothetical protein SESBI_43078 [Sesbania bispinosa]|nr:hypothetical protein SESBI_43078 [Sesbania bispinosa]
MIQVITRIKLKTEVAAETYLARLRGAKTEADEIVAWRAMKTYVAPELQHNGGSCVRQIHENEAEPQKNDRGARGSDEGDETTRRGYLMKKKQEQERICLPNLNRLLSFYFSFFLLFH